MGSRNLGMLLLGPLRRSLLCAEAMHYTEDDGHAGKRMQDLQKERRLMNSRRKSPRISFHWKSILQSMWKLLQMRMVVTGQPKRMWSHSETGRTSCSSCSGCLRRLLDKAHTFTEAVIAILVAQCLSEVFDTAAPTVSTMTFAKPARPNKFTRRHIYSTK